MPKKQVLDIESSTNEITDTDVLVDVDDFAQPEPVPQVEELEAVDMEFDRALADFWQVQSWQRLYGAVDSIRVFADALAPRETAWCVESSAEGLLDMAFHALPPGGVMYVPAEFSGSIVFAGNSFEPALHGYVRYTK